MDLRIFHRDTYDVICNNCPSAAAMVVGSVGFRAVLLEALGDVLFSGVRDLERV